MKVEFDEGRVDGIFAHLDQGRLPGAGVGIAVGGRAVYRKGFGLASMDLPIVLSPSMRMRIYSTTKQFTCLAFMLLCEAGKAHIDDRIADCLPELNPIARDVTFRQLMGHVSGLRDAKDVLFQFGGEGPDVPAEELLSLYSHIDDVNFAAGTAWCYNNGGYVLLSIAIERLSGMSLERVFAERIFAPIGMSDSLLRPSDHGFLSNSASMHATSEDGAYSRSYLRGSRAGEGGIATTVDDMLRWLAHMDRPHVGTPETWALIKTPQVLSTGTSTGYGLGLVMGKYRGVDVIFHGGGGRGANSQMLKVPSAALDVEVIVNRYDEDAADLANRVVDACLPLLESLPQGPATTPVSGVFRSGSTGVVIQLMPENSTADGKARQVAVIDAVNMEVRPDRSGVYWPNGAASHLKIGLRVLGEPAQPSGLAVTNFGNTDMLQRLPEPSENECERILGSYQSRSTCSDAVISVSPSGPQIQFSCRWGQASYALKALARGVWRATSVTTSGGILAFDEDYTSFAFSTHQTRNLPFNRVASSR